MRLDLDYELNTPNVVGGATNDLVQVMGNSRSTAR